MMKSSKRLVDHYGEDLALFEQILGWALQQTGLTPYEKQFVQSTIWDYKKWGAQMFWSVKQNTWLAKLADKQGGEYVEFANE